MSTTNNNTTPVYANLTPVYANVKSFYNKAKIEIISPNHIKLISYNILVAKVINGELKIYGTFSKTTMRHIREFIEQFCPDVDTDLKTIRAIIAKSKKN